MFYTKELTAIFKAAGLSIPAMEVDPEYWDGVRCQWTVEDRFQEADKIAEALSGGPLRGCTVYVTVGLVEIYVD